MGLAIGPNLNCLPETHKDFVYRKKHLIESFVFNFYSIGFAFSISSLHKLSASFYLLCISCLYNNCNQISYPFIKSLCLQVLKSRSYHRRCVFCLDHLALNLPALLDPGLNLRTNLFLTRIYRQKMSRNILYSHIH